MEHEHYNSQVEQVGGDHYQADFQHWDMVALTRTGYLEGNATKYLSRWRKKNGLEDLKKSYSYVDKMISFKGAYQNFSDFVSERQILRTIAFQHMGTWKTQIQLPDSEYGICFKIFTWETLADLREANQWIQKLAQDAYGDGFTMAPLGAGQVEPHKGAQGRAATIAAQALPCVGPFGYPGDG